MEDHKKEHKPENNPPAKHRHDGGKKESDQPSNENNILPEGSAESQPEKKDNGAAEEAPQAPVIAMSMEEYDALQAELEKAKAQSNDYHEGWQCERADFSNYRKRVERDAAAMQQNVTASVVKKYLVILDDLERALKTRPTSGEGSAWADGVELIYRKLSTLLEQEGVRRMEAEKEMFDPRRHEAIMQEESPDHESGQIIEVIQQGYLLGDRVIRPALVRVAK